MGTSAATQNIVQNGSLDRGSVVNETFRFLRAQRGTDSLRIAAIRLGSYFTLVELSDGSVGACASYYRLSSSVIDKCENHLHLLTSKDPLLDELLFSENQRRQLLLAYLGDQRPLLEYALQATIVSALSSPFLRRGGDESFSATTSRPSSDEYYGENVLHIGFGNFMDSLLAHPSVKRLHISDLGYLRRRDAMDGHLVSYRKRFAGKRITISDGWDTQWRFKDAQVIFITGCALCNGTLDDLLTLIEPHHKTIIIGQSASIHPIVLFQRGVHFVETTIKPQHIMQAPRQNISGDGLRVFFEGGLSSIYLHPPTTACSRQGKAHDATANSAHVAQL